MEFLNIPVDLIIEHSLGATIWEVMVWGDGAKAM